MAKTKRAWSIGLLCVVGSACIAFAQSNWSALEQLPPVPSGKYDASLPQWKEWRRRNQQDPKWEWKVPISFYGRVVDQKGAPVKDAKVTVSWTDLSFDGTSTRELLTDDQGKFSLTGVKGKHLLIRSIEKSGYRSSTTNTTGFEYAAFFEEEYHIPNDGKPVEFRMQRDGTADSLIVFSDKLKIPQNNRLPIDLKTGRLGGDDIVIELLHNSDPKGRKWIAKVSVPSGGVQATNDEFPVEAPESGYESEITINQDSPLPPGFPSGSLYKGGRFYVKTGSRYAVIEFRMVPGNRSLYFTSYHNPKEGNRNVECDTRKLPKFR